MFLKVILKKQKATGEYLMHYRLCESYRTYDTVRHRIILHLGALEELPEAEQKKEMLRRIEELLKESRTGIKQLFAAEDPVVEEMAQKFFRLIKEKRRIDTSEDNKDFHLIDTNSVKNKNVREVGCEWLCMQALEQLKVKTFLEQQGWKEEQIQLALTHIISRASYPASELRTSEHRFSCISTGPNLRS